MGPSVIPRRSYWRISSAAGLAEPLPEMRPALVGSGPNSLINLINTKRLVEQGQDHAAVLLYREIQPNGEVGGGRVYNGTPGSDKLKEEVKRCLDKARFIPAVYNHRKTDAGFFGAVRFTQNNGKPRLRIFANQEPSELEHETDFIAPQPVTVEGHYYGHVKYPAKSWSTEDVPRSCGDASQYRRLGQAERCAIAKGRSARKSFRRDNG